MFHPAVLETKFQRTHIACFDQRPGFHGKIRMDLFHQLACFLHPDSSGGAEGEVVSTKRCACQPEAQSGMAAEFQKGPPPDRSIRFVGVDSKVVRFIGDGQKPVLVPVSELSLEDLLLPSSTLVAEKPTVRLVGGAVGSVPEIQSQSQPGCSALPSGSSYTLSIR